jgi:surface antigen
MTYGAGTRSLESRFVGMKISIKTSLVIGGACLALSATSAFAQTSTTVVDHPDGTTTTKTVEKDRGGAQGGAVGGAVAGALVAGPIGAVVGGVAGAAFGHTVAPPSEVRTYVTTQTATSASYSGKIVVGKSIDGDVVYYEVPSNTKYRWAYLNGQRVVVERSSGNVVAVY